MSASDGYVCFFLSDLLFKRFTVQRGELKENILRKKREVTAISFSSIGFSHLRAL